MLMSAAVNAIVTMSTFKMSEKWNVVEDYISEGFSNFIERRNEHYP